MVLETSERVIADHTITETNAVDTGGVMSMSDAHAFTASEKQVFDLLVCGASNKAIADRLQISEAAVKSRCRHILRKLNVRTRAEAVRKAHDWHLAVARLLA